MGVLQDFERRLEGAVEGFFARAFRSGLHPIELAKAAQRYLEDNQHVSADGVVVPNRLRFRINPKDRERLSALGASLTRELAAVVGRTAAERGWRLLGAPLVEVHASDSVRFGTYELEGRVDPDTGPPQRAPLPARHRLRLADGREVPLDRGQLTVGRLPDCDVRIEDPTVSRRHATLVRRAGEWWVIDLGSTNGTTVNGTPVAEQVLRPGDRIAFGDAVVEFLEA